jgi:hypothetical protein
MLPRISSPTKFYISTKKNPYSDKNDFYLTSIDDQTSETPRTSQFKSKSPPNSNRILQSTLSHTNYLNTEVDPEFIHEIPYKDTIILKEVHVKLRKLLGERLNPVPKGKLYTISPKKIPKKSEPTRTQQLEAYLNYLQDYPAPKSFVNKLSDRAKDLEEEKLRRQLERGLQFDNYLPTDLKRLVRPELVGESPRNTDRFRRKIRTVLTFIQGMKSSNPNSPRNIDEWSSILQANSRNISSPRFKDLVSPRSEKSLKIQKSLALKSGVFSKESTIENGHARNFLPTERDEEALRNLSENIVKQFNLFNQTASKSKELVNLVKQRLKEENALDLFFGKFPKNQPLKTRIYNQMVQKGCNNTTEYESSSIVSSQRSLYQVSSTINYDRVNSFKRVLDYLTEAIIQYKVQNLHSLEEDIMNTHNELKQKEISYLKRLRSFNRKKYYEVRDMPDRNADLPLHPDPIQISEKLNNYEISHGELKKIRKETKTINKNIESVFNNVRDTVLFSNK